MEKFEIEAANYYFAGIEKTNLSIYSVIVLNRPEYKINLKSAAFNGKNWKWRQIFTGEDDNMPLMTWEDVVKFTKLELDRLSSIIEPLLNDNKLEAWKKYHEINNGGCIITGLESIQNEEYEELDYIERIIRGDNNKSNDFNSKWVFLPLDDYTTSQRTKIEHWLPIWTAWKTFYDRLIIDIEKGNLINP